MQSKTPTDEELRQLGKEWFAKAREQSEKDDAELRDWNKERRKWSAGGDGGSFFSGGADSGGGDGGGGD